MEYVAVGASGLTVSRIGFGCAAIGGYDYGTVDDSISIRAIHAALDSGVTLFDVADVYGFGHAETVLGRALRDVPGRAVIATKVGVRWDGSTGKTKRDLSPDYLVAAIDGSLRRLQVDCLDICQIHWPLAHISPAETAGALERLRKAGKIRVLGVCNVDPSWFAQAQSASRFDVLQLPCNLLENGTLASLACAVEDHGMTTFVYNALAHGLLTGKYDERSRFDKTDLRNRAAAFHGERLHAGLEFVRVLRDVAIQIGRTPAEVAIRWLLDRSEVSCVLTGIKTPQQAISNASAVGWRLSEDARSYLLTVAAKACS